MKKIHLKGAPCGFDTSKPHSYTVHLEYVTCKECINPKRTPKPKAKAGKEKAELTEKK